MKKLIEQDPFSNGTAHMMFEEYNCDKCIKSSVLKKDQISYTNADENNMFCLKKFIAHPLAESKFLLLHYINKSADWFISRHFLFEVNEFADWTCACPTLQDSKSTGECLYRY